MFRRAGPQTLSDYARDYGLLRDVKPGTLRQYQIVAGLFTAWSGHDVRLDELDEDSVSAWLRDYAAEAAPATVRSKRATILALWRAAADDQLCDPPTRRVRALRRSAPRPVVEAWLYEEVEALLLAAQGLKRRHRCGLPRSIWWDLAIRVAWDSGLRWGDLVALQVAQIRPDGTATVIQQKTGRAVGIRLSESTLAALRASLEACPRTLVLPWPASQESFIRQSRLLVKKAEIRAGTWKWLRRSSGSYCERDEPGTGASHLGHAPGSRIFHDYYAAPAIVARATRLPQELPANVVGPATWPASSLYGPPRR
jgi:integrase